MFILVQVKDTLRIPPEDAALLQKDILHLLRVEINNKYANKVLNDIGLCIVVHSILAYDEPQLYPGDAGPYVHCTFRMAVFQPIEGEMLMAKISASDETKIMLSMDFFDNIIIDPKNLPENTSFNQEENVWVWNNDGTEYFYDSGVMVRFKVSNLIFASQHTAVSPNSTLTLTQQKALKYGYTIDKKPVNNAGQVISQTPLDMNTQTNQQLYVAPLTIFGTMQDAGLGPVEWWD